MMIMGYKINKSELTLIIVLILLIAFGIVGWTMTPTDDRGQPLLLLPDVKKVEDYRKDAKNWTEELTLLDGRLAVLMSDNSNDLYSQSKDSQDLFNDYINIVKDIENTEAPAALTGLKNMLDDTASSYLNACQSALIWVSNSTDENHVATENLVAEAQNKLNELEKSTWMK
jgi:hypothetical protein